MKKVKEWLNGKKIDDKIRQELRQVLVQKIGWDNNSKETREKAVKIAIEFLSNLDCDFDRVKCNEENNSPDVIDAGHMILEIFEDLGTNSSYKVHKIKI